MKHSIRTSLLVFAGLALTGCRSISFLYSLVEGPQDVAKDVDVSGVWTSAGQKESWTFERQKDGSYSLTWRDKEDTLQLEAQVVRLSNYLFLDLASKPEGSAITGHLFGRLRIDGDTLAVAWLDNDWMERKLAKERALPFELPCTGKERRCYVVTASTADLQNFLLRNASDETAFEKWESLTRVQPGQ